MPKVSKVKVTYSRPDDPPSQGGGSEKYYCARCGRPYKKLKTNFPKSQSPLFRGWGGYIPICNECMDELYEHYRYALEDDMEAMRRICLKLDIYWSRKLYASAIKTGTIQSRVRSYISKTNLVAYAGKTYDDTLDEEVNARKKLESMAMGAEQNTQEYDAEPEIEEEVPIDSETISFWGSGFSADQYAELNVRFARWTEDVPTPIDVATESLYKQACILEMTISRNAAIGRPTEQTVNALNNVLGSLNAKPIQKKNDERTDEAADSQFDSLPFGVGIKIFENARPIPKPDPRLNDVDGVVRYISIWFLGHLCKMLGIRNTYCKLYEAEIAKMRIERPEFDEEDDEEVFNNIFGDDVNESAEE